MFFFTGTLHLNKQNYPNEHVMKKKSARKSCDKLIYAIPRWHAGITENFLKRPHED